MKPDTAPCKSLGLRTARAADVEMQHSFLEVILALVRIIEANANQWAQVGWWYDCGQGIWCASFPGNHGSCTLAGPPESETVHEVEAYKETLREEPLEELSQAAAPERTEGDGENDIKPEQPREDSEYSSAISENELEKEVPEDAFCDLLLGGADEEAVHPVSVAKPPPRKRPPKGARMKEMRRRGAVNDEKNAKQRVNDEKKARAEGNFRNE